MRRTTSTLRPIGVRPNKAGAKKDYSYRVAINCATAFLIAALIILPLSPAFAQSSGATATPSSDTTTSVTTTPSPDIQTTTSDTSNASPTTATPTTDSSAASQPATSD